SPEANSISTDEQPLVPELSSTTALVGPEAPRGPITVSGTFTATRACALYQSKRRQPNPNGLETSVSTQYAIREAQERIDDGWAWLRVETNNAQSPLRWVSAKCGTVSELAERSSQPTTFCNLAGKQDSHVLAISWQPAFCENKPEKA